MKVLHVLTVADSLIFLRRRSAWMAERGVRTEVVTSPSPRLDDFGHEEGVVTHGVDMRRAISPFADVVAVVRLVRLMRLRRPDIVHAHTPKGGLLGMLAARITGVPVRIYHIHGLPFETATGLKRILLVSSEWLSCRLSTHVLAVSESILDIARDEGVCPSDRGDVLGQGSINGVDFDRFSRERVDNQARTLRRDLGIPHNAPVVGFIGRLVTDKGIVTLAAAWALVREREPTSVLLLVGDWEEGDPVPPETRIRLENDPRVIILGYQRDPAPAYALLSVLAFPSRREGFGLAAIEASALGVPVVGTRIPGLVDAVADGQTGTLVDREDPQALSQAITSYLTDRKMASIHGAEGERRVRTHFRPEKIWDDTLNVYRQASRLIPRT